MKNNLIAGALASLFLVSSTYAEGTKKCFSVEKHVKLINLGMGFNRLTKKDFPDKTRDQVIAILKTQKNIDPMNMKCSLGGFVRSGYENESGNYLYALGTCQGYVKSKLGFDHWLDFNFKCKHNARKTATREDFVKDPSLSAFSGYTPADFKDESLSAITGYNVTKDLKEASLSAMTGCTIPVNGDNKPLLDKDGYDLFEYSIHDAVKNDNGVWTKRLGELSANFVAEATDKGLYDLAFDGAAKNVKLQATVKTFKKGATETEKIHLTVHYVPSAKTIDQYYIEPIAVNESLTLGECK